MSSIIIESVVNDSHEILTFDLRYLSTVLKLWDELADKETVIPSSFQRLNRATSNVIDYKYVTQKQTLF